MARKEVAKMKIKYRRRYWEEMKGTEGSQETMKPYTATNVPVPVLVPKDPLASNVMHARGRWWNASVMGWVLYLEKSLRG